MWKYALLVLCFASLFFDCHAGRSNDYQLVEAPRVEVLLQKKVPGRIVNGTKAVLGQFPQQVSLRRRYTLSHFCGGSILTPEWILTAGHCMLDKFGEFIDAYTIVIVAGETVLVHTNKARQWSNVIKRIVHPQFDLDSLQNDVALLKLETKLMFDPYVKPAPLMRDLMVPYTLCQVSGWGYEKYQGSVSSNLLFVEVPLLPIPVCRKLLKKFSSVPPGMFCAGYIEGGKDACQGDSGGGMLCEGYLTGVVSGGEGCAWPRLPGLYADIRYYLPWIEQYVNLTEKHFVRSKPYARAASSALQSTSIAILVCAIGALINL